MKKEHIYESLKEFREDRGMSRKELGAKLGFTASSAGVSVGVAEREGASAAFIERFQSEFSAYKVRGVNYPEEKGTESKETKIELPDGHYRIDDELIKIEEAPTMEAEEDANRVIYLIMRNNEGRAYLDKNKAALLSWDLAIKNEEHEIFEVEVE